jgi:hypothetical protein
MSRTSLASLNIYGTNIATSIKFYDCIKLQLSLGYVTLQTRGIKCNIPTDIPTDILLIFLLSSIAVSQMYTGSDKILNTEQTWLLTAPCSGVPVDGSKELDRAASSTVSFQTRSVNTRFKLLNCFRIKGCPQIILTLHSLSE